jgi:hypothetical protein
MRAGIELYKIAATARPQLVLRGVGRALRDLEPWRSARPVQLVSSETTHE